MFSKLKSNYWFWLSVIVVFAFITRIYRIGVPKEYIFDEVYHAVTAKLIRRNDPRAYEWWNPPVEPDTAVDWLHPPFAKYTQALSMDIFGENSFGWRFSSAIFGTFVIIATAFLADELFKSKKIALLAAFLAACDGLLLTQSRIAMNDIHVTFFILLTLLFYVKLRHALSEKNPAARWFLFLTGVCAGLAMGSKWSGIFGLVVIWAFELFLSSRKTFLSIRHWLPRVLLLAALPSCIYVLSYTHMFLQGKTLICEGNEVEQGKCYCSQDSSFGVDVLKKIWPSRSAEWEAMEARGGCKQLISHFAELHHQIWWYQTNLKATHSFQSRPWQWFLDLRPVWFYAHYDGDTEANIYAQGNPVLFWFGDVAVVASIIYCIACIAKRKKTFPLFFLLFAYFMVWLPWQLSPRIMFFYHYTPAVPLLAIILSYWLVTLNKAYQEKRGLDWGLILLLISVLLIFICFVIFYPNWTGIEVPTKFADAVYFAVPSWK